MHIVINKSIVPVGCAGRRVASKVTVRHGVRCLLSQLGRPGHVLSPGGWPAPPRVWGPWPLMLSLGRASWGSLGRAVTDQNHTLQNWFC